MEEETMENQPSTNSSLYYVLGAIVLVAVIVAGYLLRPKPATTGEQAAGVPATITPMSGPITELACENQYYNPVLGFPKYYFSVEGADPVGASSVDCTFTFTQENKVVAVEKVTGPLLAKPERNGNVFKCITPGLDLKPSIPTKVDVVLRDDEGAKATCSAMFTLPKS
jgi:hypothetical protein